MKEKYKKLTEHEKYTIYEEKREQLKKQKLSTKEYDKAIDKLVKDLGM